MPLRGRIALLRRAGDGDQSGMTLPELLVSMAITTVVLVMAMAGILSVLRTDQYAEEDSRALAELRTAMAELTTELREARVVFPGTGTSTSTARRIYFWIDRNANNVQETSERVIWEVTGTGTDGTLVRRTDANTTNVVRANEIAVANTFRYLAITTAGKVVLAPPNTTLVEITLTADVSPTSHGRARVVTTEVRLRNAATRT